MIIVYYDPFDMESRIYLMNGEQVVDTYVRTAPSEVAKTVADTCYNLDIADVKIHAPKHIYDEISRIIYELEGAEHYGLNKIILENV